MTSFNIGHNLTVQIFGQSHAEAIGAVVDGLPAGKTIDLAQVERFMDRRAPGKNAFSTARREADALLAEAARAKAEAEAARAEAEAALAEAKRLREAAARSADVKDGLHE